MAELLAVEGARLERRGRAVLDGVDLALDAGDWATLLGPNGAGKTTLTSVIGGLIPLTAGRVSIAGAPAGYSSPLSVRRRVGLVPQEPALYPTLTVAENLEAFARLHGVAPSARAARIEWGLSFSGLAARAGERVARLSGGMVRRLNIACALLHEPPLVLLDEPTVGVDPQARERIYEMLEALRQRGTTLLYTTHAFEEAERLSSRVLVLDRGQVLAAGCVADVIAQAGLAASEVSIRVAPESPPVEVPGLRRARDSYRGSLVDPGPELARMLDALNRARTRILEVSTHAASLNDAFFALTGRSLRE